MLSICEIQCILRLLISLALYDCLFSQKSNGYFYKMRLENKILVFVKGRLLCISAIDKTDNARHSDLKKCDNIKYVLD